MTFRNRRLRSADESACEVGSPVAWLVTLNFDGMWVEAASDPREALETGRGEKAVLAEYLNRYRMTFELKYEGLTAEQLATRSVPPSTMSLLGMIRPTSLGSSTPGPAESWKDSSSCRGSTAPRRTRAWTSTKPWPTKGSS